MEPSAISDLNWKTKNKYESFSKVCERCLALKLSISNGVFSDLTLEENIKAIKNLGFENLEFNMKSIKLGDDLSVHVAKRLVNEFGLNCLTLHAATLPVKDEVEVHRAVYYGKISADFAYSLSAPIMSIHSNVSRELPQNLKTRLLTRIFSEIKPYTESLGLQLALENLSYTSKTFGKNVAELEEIFSVIDDGSLGMTLDFCHAIAKGVAQTLLEKYINRLSNVHISNRVHKPFAEETPDLKEFIAKLRLYRYNGPMTIELARKSTTEEILKTKAILETALGIL